MGSEKASTRQTVASGSMKEASDEQARADRRVHEPSKRQKMHDGQTGAAQSAG